MKAEKERILFLSLRSSFGPGVVYTDTIFILDTDEIILIVLQGKIIFFDGGRHNLDVAAWV